MFAIGIICSDIFKKTKRRSAACNEIHGAWYDPSNPVVPMSGTLRSDLLEQLLEWEGKTDLCLALGSSLCGMNADRMVTSPSQRAKHGHGLGSVLVSLQQTQYDTISSLRIYERIDVVMSMLGRELQLTVGDSPAKFSVGNGHQYTALPFNEEGILDHAAQLSLDLRPGQWVSIVDQPKWDEERVGSVGQVRSTLRSILPKIDRTPPPQTFNQKSTASPDHKILGALFSFVNLWSCNFDNFEWL